MQYSSASGVRAEARTPRIACSTSYQRIALVASADASVCVTEGNATLVLVLTYVAQAHPSLAASSELFDELSCCCALLRCGTAVPHHSDASVQV